MGIPGINTLRFQLLIAIREGKISISQISINGHINLVGETRCIRRYLYRISAQTIQIYNGVAYSTSKQRIIGSYVPGVFAVNQHDEVDVWPTHVDDQFLKDFSSQYFSRYRQ